MKKLTYMLTGLALLANVAFAQNLEISITNNNNEIIIVCNKKALGPAYIGDVFYNYRKEDCKWILDKMTYLGKGRNKREFVKQVTEEEVPTYTEGFSSLYYDPDQDEENLVTNWEDNIDFKVKAEWIRKAIEHVKELNSTLFLKK